MADMISASEAKNILGCDDATLNNHINNGSIRAQRVDGQMQVNHEDVLRLSTGSESDDDGTLILASESDDFSIDLGEVVDDSAATMVHGHSDDAQITFNDSDGLEMPDLDAEATQDMGTTDATADLSFTESNTAVVTSVDETMVDETMVDQTAADLQTVDYGDTSYDDNPRRSNSGRVSQRSIRSQRVEFEEDEVHVAWPILMGLSLVICLLSIPYIYMMSWPTGNADSGEKLPGTVDNFFTNMAASVVGFSVEPDAARHKQIDPSKPHIEMGKDVDPQGGQWRYKQWMNGKDEIAERLKHFTIREVTLDDSGKPTAAVTQDNQSVTVQELQVETPDGQPSQGSYKTDIPY